MGGPLFNYMNIFADGFDGICSVMMTDCMELPPWAMNIVHNFMGFFGKWVL
jgi:hypothetical protein